MSNIQKRPNGKWRARFRDDTGREHARHFERKVDAQRWLDDQTAALVTGQFVDPRAGKITLKEYAESWRASQVHRPSSAAHVETMLRRHVYPELGARAIASILPSDIQGLVRGMGTARPPLQPKGKARPPLSPATIGVAHSILAGVFKSAVRDRKIAASPCESTRLPKDQPKLVEPLPTEAVQQLAASVPARYRALVILGAGTGLRISEALGLTVDRIDFLRRTLRIDRQLVLVAGREPYLGSPKTTASVRTIPVAQVVLDELAAHLAAFPACESGLVFTDEQGRAIRRTRVSDWWGPAASAAGLPKGATSHDLRHYFASLLIRHGESVKTVQARLGHASAAETLDTYSHLWPDSDDRTREAVEAVLRPVADSLRTAEPH